MLRPEIVIIIHRYVRIIHYAAVVHVFWDTARSIMHILFANYSGLLLPLLLFFTVFVTGTTQIGQGGGVCARFDILTDAI
jgi:hypothetical protein